MRQKHYVAVEIYWATGLQSECVWQNALGVGNIIRSDETLAI